MTLPQNEPASKGFAAGLRMGLAALLAFYFLGYPAGVSILFGILAGVALGMIVYWWELKEQHRPKPVVPEDSLVDMAQVRRRQSRSYARYRHTRTRQPLLLKLERFAFWKR
jgi:hypothetical protein